MSDLFLPRPFLEPGVLRLFGRPKGRPAVLADHALRVDVDGMRLVLVPTPGSSVEGAIVSGSAGAPVRQILAAMGGSAQRVEVLLDDRSSALVQAAVAEVEAAPAGVWAADRWRREDAQVLREVVGEFLGQAGREDGAVMGQVLPWIASRAQARVRGAARRVPRNLGTALGRTDVEPLSISWPYGRFFAVEEHVLRHRRHDGTMSPPLARGVFTSSDAVTVLPFDPWQGTVLMVEQFRAGIYARRDRRPWSLEAVAGRCDGMEAPEETARREAEEEAGLHLGRLEQAAAYYTTPGIAAEFLVSFVGEADLGAAGGLHGLAEENEDIRAVVAPLEVALEAAENGEIANAPLILTLHWLARHRERITAEWGSVPAPALDAG